MNEFIKSEAYINFIDELDRRIEFYNDNIFNPFESRKLILHSIKLEFANNFIKELNKAKCTILNTEIDKFQEIFYEIRENIVKRVKCIPRGPEATKSYIRNYEAWILNRENDEVMVAYGIDKDEPKLIIRNGEPDFDFIVYRDELKEYKNGKQIPNLIQDEKILSSIALYFEFDRSYIAPDKSYNGIEIVRGANSELLTIAHTLIRNNYLGHYHILPFCKLLAGREYCEPISWIGSLSDLNKFIKSLYSIRPKSIEGNNIEWKALSRLFIINGEHPDSDKLKGASNSKMDNLQELQPFLSYCRNTFKRN